MWCRVSQHPTSRDTLEVRGWLFFRGQSSYEFDLSNISQRDDTICVGISERQSFPHIMQPFIELPVGIEKASAADASPAIGFHILVKDDEIRQSGTGIEGGEESGELQPI